MTTWKDGGNYGILYREVTEDGSRAICRVKVRQLLQHAKGVDYKNVRPYPQGEADFRLILAAPQMLEALCSIRDKIECYLQPDSGSSVSRARWESVRNLAVDAIATAKGENDDSFS